MSLEEYRRKRNAARTPEPMPPDHADSIPPDLAIHNITIVSSVNGQTGGGPPLHGLPTTGFACGISSTPYCSWSPTNTGENDALQILIESTQRGSLPNPPPPPPPTDFLRVR